MHVPRFELRCAYLPLALSAALAATTARAADTADLLPDVPDTSAPTQRLIVRFNDGAAGAGLQREIDRTVGSAMIRAGATGANAGAHAHPAGVTHLRRLGTGADLIQVPAGLSAPKMQRLVDEIAADPAVRYVELDTMQQIAAGPATTTFTPNDPQYASLQWHFHDPVGGVNAPAAWAMSRGAGAVVAVLDTGILPHPDFEASRVLPGYDFITDSAVSRRPTSGRVAGALDYGDWAAAGECRTGSAAENSSWHGTHVAGTIVQATDNGIGGAGLAPEAYLLPVRVLGRCGGWQSDIADAIVWASGGRVSGVPDNQVPADIINLSLGGEGTCTRAYQEAIDAAVGRGSLVVVAAGNSAVDVATRRPASCKNIVNVAATSKTGRIASYSDYGSGVDLSGPGGDYQGAVWQAGYSGTTTPTSGEYTYVGKTGTSMATPHVSAVAALVQTARFDAGRSLLAPAQMEALLVGTARPFPAAPPAAKPIGSGIVDAAAALRRALDERCDVALGDCAAVAAATGTVLTPQVPASNQSSAVGAGGRRYTVTAQAGRPLRIFSYGGRGDAALYVRQGAPAQPGQFDARSARPGSHQAVLINAPVEGVYHVLLDGAPAYEGVTIAVRQ